VRYYGKNNRHISKKNIVYNNIAPTKTLKMEEDEQLIKVYVYTSEVEMNKGLKKFEDEISKDLTFIPTKRNWQLTS
jgi:hypothetical protein